MIPTTVERVPQHTSKYVNQETLHHTKERVVRCAAEGPEAIEKRLAELDCEWDIERTLEANAASVSLVGLAMGAAIGRKWYLLPAAVAAFLLQHAVQGWCPPLPVFRRLGFRTQSEIDYERYALKAIRGDFRRLSSSNSNKGAKVKRAVDTMRRP